MYLFVCFFARLDRRMNEYSYWDLTSSTCEPGLKGSKRFLMKIMRNPFALQHGLDTSLLNFGSRVEGRLLEHRGIEPTTFQLGKWRLSDLFYTASC